MAKNTCTAIAVFLLVAFAPSTYAGSANPLCPKYPCYLCRDIERALTWIATGLDDNNEPSRRPHGDPFSDLEDSGRVYKAFCFEEYQQLERNLSEIERINMDLSKGKIGSSKLSYDEIRESVADLEKLKAEFELFCGKKRCVPTYEPNWYVFRGDTTALLCDWPNNHEATQNELRIQQYAQAFVRATPDPDLELIEKKYSAQGHTGDQEAEKTIQCAVGEEFMPTGRHNTTLAEVLLRSKKERYLIPISVITTSGAPAPTILVDMIR